MVQWEFCKGAVYTESNHTSNRSAVETVRVVRLVCEFDYNEEQPFSNIHFRVILQPWEGDLTSGVLSVSSVVATEAPSFDQ